MGIISGYKDKIAKEVSELCEEVLSLLDETLIAEASGIEPTVFYLTMKGDCYRYLAELFKGSDDKAIIEKAQEAYKQAIDVARSLRATHHIRLGLALSYSVFYYEIVEDPEIACKLAKNAFDSAIGELDTTEERDERDSAPIMQLLRDNFIFWTKDVKEND